MEKLPVMFNRPTVLNVHKLFTTVSLLKCCFLQVDKHIRRLDTDLARFEADLKEKQIESTDYDSTSSKGKKGVCPLYLLHVFIFCIDYMLDFVNPHLVEFLIKFSHNSR